MCILNLLNSISLVFIKRLKLWRNFINPKVAARAEATVKSLSILMLIGVYMSILIITYWIKGVNQKDKFKCLNKIVWYLAI